MRVADSLISMDSFRRITFLENQGNEKIEAELKKVCEVFIYQMDYSIL